MFTRFLGSQNASPDGKLRFADITAERLVQQWDTPLYVLDAADFRSKAREFVRAAQAAHSASRVSYAVKANSAVALLALAEEAGLFADTTSEGEMEAALRAGFPPHRIHLHGSNKSDREIERALEENVGCVIIDHLSEIARLANIAQRHGRTQPVMLRLTPGVDPVTHEAIRTGQEDTKFGFNIADGSAEGAVRAITQSPSLRLIGYHCHVGSQLLDSEAHCVGAARLAEFIAATRSLTGDIEELNVGGGLGVRYLNDERPETFDRHCARVEEAVRAVFEPLGLPIPRIGYEPGRALVGEAGATLYRAGVIKTVTLPKSTERQAKSQLSGQRNYLSVDGGMADNPRPQLYGAVYTAMNADRLSEPHDTPFCIAGRHCESDTLIPQATLPASTAEGDVIAVQCTGAYNLAMSSNYNRYPRPALVIVGDGEPYLAVARETLDDLFRLETISPKARISQLR